MSARLMIRSETIPTNTQIQVGHFYLFFLFLFLRVVTLALLSLTPSDVRSLMFLKDLSRLMLFFVVSGCGSLV